MHSDQFKKLLQIMEDFNTARAKFIQQGNSPEVVDQALKKFKQLRDQNFFYLNKQVPIRDANNKVIPNQFKQEIKGEIDWNNIDWWAMQPNGFKELLNKMGTTFTITKPKPVVKEDYIQLIDNTDWLVVVPLTKTKSIEFGTGTVWCTARTRGTNYWTTYFRNNKTCLIYCIDKHDQTERYAIRYDINNPTKILELRDKKNNSLTKVKFAEIGLDVDQLISESQEEKSLIFSYMTGESQRRNKGTYATRNEEILNMLVKDYFPRETTIHSCKDILEDLSEEGIIEFDMDAYDGFFDEYTEDNVDTYDDANWQIEAMNKFVEKNIKKIKLNKNDYKTWEYNGVSYDNFDDAHNAWETSSPEFPDESDYETYKTDEEYEQALEKADEMHSEWIESEPNKNKYTFNWEFYQSDLEDAEEKLQESFIDSEYAENARYDAMHRMEDDNDVFLNATRDELVLEFFENIGVTVIGELPETP